MIDVTHLPLFLFAAFVLLITPGPAVLYIVTRSIDRGRTAGLISVLSVELGTFVHVFAATFGLSALLVSSAMAFAVVKYLGAIYLIVLGVAPSWLTLERRHPPISAGRSGRGSSLRCSIPKPRCSSWRSSRSS